MTTNAPAQNLPVAADQLRDIKPPLEPFNPWPWIALAAALVVVAVAAAFLIWWLLRRRRLQVSQPPLVPAHVRARQKLEDALAFLGEPKTFCILVSDTIRVYLEERFTFHAPDRTTEEFLHELRSTDRLLPDQKESLGEFLQRCDLVKFARYEPREAELRGLHAAALRLVEETEPQPEPLATAAGSIAHRPSPIAYPR